MSLEIAIQFKVSAVCLLWYLFVIAVFKQQYYDVVQASTNMGNCLRWFTQAAKP